MPNIPGAVTDPSRVRGEAIELKSGSDTIRGYLARPSQPGRNPGIVVIDEAFGLVEHIRDIARRFANIGYNALAPDLYTRAGGPSDPGDMATVMPVMFGKPDAEAVRDLEAAAAHLRGLSGATAKVGAIGFCSGGRQTLLFACSRTRSTRRSTAGAGLSIGDPRYRNHIFAAKADPRFGRAACTARSLACLAKRTRIQPWHNLRNYARGRNAPART